MPSSESVVIPRDKLAGCQRWEIGRFDAPSAQPLSSLQDNPPAALVAREDELGRLARYLEAALETIANGASNYGPNPAGALARTAIENTLPKVATGEMTAKQALDVAAELYVAEATKQGYIK